MRYLVTAVLVCAVGLAGCQNAPPTAATSNAVSVDHAAEARKAFAAREWATAAPHFRAAIALDPGSLTLHHGLATCASWLGLLDEAKAEFNWVLAHAPAGSPEAQIAREWLANAETENEATNTADANAPGSKVGDAAVHGLVTWESPNQARSVLPRAQLHLKGLPDGPTKGVSYYMRTDKEGRYRFDKIKAGTYRLTDAIAGDTKWNLKIDVKSGEDLELNLDPGNSTASRNDFPPAAEATRPTPPS